MQTKVKPKGYNKTASKTQGGTFPFPDKLMELHHYGKVTVLKARITYKLDKVTGKKNSRGRPPESRKIFLFVLLLFLLSKDIYKVILLLTCLYLNLFQVQTKYIYLKT